MSTLLPIVIDAVTIAIKDCIPQMESEDSMSKPLELLAAILGYAMYVMWDVNSASILTPNATFARIITI